MPIKSKVFSIPGVYVFTPPAGVTGGWVTLVPGGVGALSAYLAGYEVYYWYPTPGAGSSEAAFNIPIKFNSSMVVTVGMGGAPGALGGVSKIGKFQVLDSTSYYGGYSLTDLFQTYTNAHGESFEWMKGGGASGGSIDTTIVLSDELIANQADRDFSSDTGNWTGRNWSIAGNKITWAGETSGINYDNTLFLAQAAFTSLTIGKAYQVTYTVTTTTPVLYSDALYVSIAYAATQSRVPSGVIGIGIGAVTYTQINVLQSPEDYSGNENIISLKFAASASWRGSISNVSVREYNSIIETPKLGSRESVSFFAGSSGGLLARPVDLVGVRNPRLANIDYPYPGNQVASINNQGAEQAVWPSYAPSQKAQWDDCYDITNYAVAAKFVLNWDLAITSLKFGYWETIGGIYAESDYINSVDWMVVQQPVVGQPVEEVGTVYASGTETGIGQYSSNTEASAWVVRTFKNNSNSPGTSLTITVDYAFVGNTYLIAFACDGTVGSTVTCTDNASVPNTYVVDVNKAAASPSSSNVRTCIIRGYIANTTGLTTITITHPSVTARAAIVTEFHGIDAVSPLDKTASAIGTSTAANSGATAVTAQNYELVFGAIGYEQDILTAPAGGTVGTGMTVTYGSNNQRKLGGTECSGAAGTTGGTSTNNISVHACSGLQTTASTQRADATIPSTDWSACVATYKVPVVYYYKEHQLGGYNAAYGTEQFRIPATADTYLPPGTYYLVLKNVITVGGSIVKWMNATTNNQDYYDYGLYGGDPWNNNAGIELHNATYSGQSYESSSGTWQPINVLNPPYQPKVANHLLLETIGPGPNPGFIPQHAAGAPGHLLGGISDSSPSGGGGAAASLFGAGVNGGVIYVGSEIVLYDNGAYNGTLPSSFIHGVYNTGTGYATATSFTLAEKSVVTSFSIVVQLTSDSLLRNVWWAIVQQPVIGTSNSGLSYYNGYATIIEIEEEIIADGLVRYKFLTNVANGVTLLAGTYYLMLGNCIVQNRTTGAFEGTAAWDKNNGPSTSYDTPNLADNIWQSTSGSTALTIFGYVQTNQGSYDGDDATAIGAGGGGASTGPQNDGSGAGGGASGGTGKDGYVAIFWMGDDAVDVPPTPLSFAQIWTPIFSSPELNAIEPRFNCIPRASHGALGECSFDEAYFTNYHPPGVMSGYFAIPPYNTNLSNYDLFYACWFSVPFTNLTVTKITTTRYTGPNCTGSPIAAGVYQIVPLFSSTSPYYWDIAGSQTAHCALAFPLMMQGSTRYLYNWSGYGTTLDWVIPTGGSIRIDIEALDTIISEMFTGSLVVNHSLTEPSDDPISPSGSTLALNTPPPSYTPIVTFTATPSSLSIGDYTTLQWTSSGAVDCIATGGIAGWPSVSKTLAATEYSNPTVTTVYTLTWHGPTGDVVSLPVTVTVINANLSALTISSGTLSPSFASSTISYTDAVSSGTTSVTVTPTAADPLATITVNGSPVVSGNPSSAISLSVGANAITVVVTAIDTITTKTYTITVTRASPPPANDNFVDRITIAPSGGVVTGSNVGCTKEAGEPSHGGNAGGKSVWWSWTPSSSGSAIISTGGSSYDTTLGVYTGATVSTLTVVPGGSDDDSGPGSTSQVTITVTSGVEYKIAVDGWGGASGSITLTVTPPP